MQTNYKQRLIYIRDLLMQLVGRDLKLRYRGSVLGIVWSLLNPLVQLLVFSFVFRSVLPLEIPNYTIYLFIGLLMWSWFQASLTGSATVIVDGRNLIRRPAFPAAILPAVVILANLLHFLLALPILIFFVWLARIPMGMSFLFLPVIVLLQALFTLGLSYFIATFHVFFRDTQHLVGVFLFLLFYLTPIFYRADAIPARYQMLYRLNPVLQLLEAYRAVLLDNTLPSMRPLILLLGASAIALVLGYSFFVQASYRFVEEL